MIVIVKVPGGFQPPEVSTLKGVPKATDRPLRRNLQQHWVGEEIHLSKSLFTETKFFQLHGLTTRFN